MPPYPPFPSSQGMTRVVRLQEDRAREVFDFFVRETKLGEA